MSDDRPSRLLNDLYQLAMAQGLWRSGRAEVPSIFHLFFRRAPFGGGFIVAAGQDEAIRRATEVSLTDSEVDYLSGLRDSRDRPLFDPGFLEFLGRLRPACRIDGVAEGTIVFGGEPVLRVEASLIEAQLLETPLLNAMAFPSLIATKAARVRLAAGSDPILEFGLRRAPGGDGGLAASRASYLGGTDATSNLEAGRRWGIPVRGTHAHSWVLSFESESEAMGVWLRQESGEPVLLLDTFDTTKGLERALSAVRKEGSGLDAVRLDSGDLDRLSRAVRRRLDEAGFTSTQIVASGDLDEFRIARLKASGAPIDIWGVGTQLITGAPDAALPAVYKLGAIVEGGKWVRRSKSSDEPSKGSLPGCLSVVRFLTEHGWRGDTIIDDLADREAEASSGLPAEAEGRLRKLSKLAPVKGARPVEIFETLVEEGSSTGGRQSLAACRDRLRIDLGRLPPGVRSLAPPGAYPVVLEPELAARIDGWEPDGLRYDRKACDSFSPRTGNSG